MSDKSTLRNLYLRHLYSGQAVFLLAACLTSIHSAGQKPTAATPQAGYRFVPGDGVLIRFFDAPELNDEQQIRPDGNISLQLIGEVHLSGRSVPEATKELEQRYYSEIKSPRVTIQVRSYAGQKVYVTGEVQRPGTISLIGGQDVLSAIAEAGGVRQSGKTHTAILVRKGPDGKILVRKVPLDAGQVAEILQPFDMIVVPARVIVKVDRFVEEYIRGVVPANMEAGFQYLYNPTATAVSVVPF
jgi:polysaccharide export outer membrane protein